MGIEKRYQIFISSTFRDLIDERQAVLKAVLELDHMPAGMELFPATDDNAWQLIKDVIDGSDYYVLIIGGKYGSLDEAGIGYTEKEYEYAVSTKKPVIPLLHEKPDSLPRDKTETEGAAWKKLEGFREKVEAQHTCVYWTSTDDLKSKVILGLTSTVKRKPALGWIRADQVPSGATITDILSLKEKVAELEKELETTRTGPPPGADGLCQGDDPIKIELTFDASSLNDLLSGTRYEAEINPTWNDIFSEIAPELINESRDYMIRTQIERYLSKFAKEEFEEGTDFKQHTISNFSFKKYDIDTCIIQLRALGLIRESDKKRSLKDTEAYWTLTPYGNQKMVQLRALHKSPPKQKRSVGVAKLTTGNEDRAESDS